jgi:stress-induced morphogen
MSHGFKSLAQRHHQVVKDHQASATIGRIAFLRPFQLGYLLARVGGSVITPDVLTDYVRKSMPDAVVTVTDRTGTMNHLKVSIVSAAFAGKNLLDRHRMIYQALDAPMKDGRIHALELTAKTHDET